MNNSDNILKSLKQRKNTIEFDTVLEREDGNISIDVTAIFYDGEFDSFNVMPDIQLTDDEQSFVVDAAIELFGESWDENGWQANREEKEEKGGE